jgi:hypothetical protein
MKFVIDIPDEDIFAVAGKIISFGPETQPSFDDAVSEIQNYMNSPYDKVRILRAKDDPEIIAKIAEIQQKKQEYIDLVSQKSGTIKENVTIDSIAVSELINSK